MSATRRRSPKRAGHAPCASCRRSRALKLPRACPNALALSHFAFLAFHRALQESIAVRHCSAFAPLASPPQKRVALFVRSYAVTYSTSSTSQLRQLDLGKVAVTFLTPLRHGRAGDLTVASTAPFPSSIFSSRLAFSFTSSCLGVNPSTNAGPAAPGHGRAPPCAMAESPSSVAGAPKDR